MDKYIHCITTFFGHPVIRYGQVLFILVAVMALELQSLPTACVLFLTMYLCRFPLAYDIISLPVMVVALLTLRSRPAWEWFVYVLAAYAVLELLKLSPFLLLRYMNGMEQK